MTGRESEERGRMRKEGESEGGRRGGDSTYHIPGFNTGFFIGGGGHDALML